MFWELSQGSGGVLLDAIVKEFKRERATTDV